MLARRLGARLGFALLVALSAPAEAAISIDWVPVGEPGNPCDTQSQGCFGAVASSYRIGRYEVTNAQYVEFLNAVAADDPNALYSTGMAGGLGGIARSGSAGSYSYGAIAGRGSLPVNHVSWYDTLRFVNWLANGQPTGAQGPGTTETGTYTLTGPASVSGGRAPGAAFFLPSEDEWYKAAFFDPALGLYYDYPAGSDAQTQCAAPTATANRANCGSVVGDLTDVGAYPGSPSPFGSFDQGGNVWEWNEADIFGDGSGRGLRGASWSDGPGDLEGSGRIDDDPSSEDEGVGFRVASVPEPGTGVLVLAGLLGFAGSRRRRVQLP